MSELSLLKPASLEEARSALTDGAVALAGGVELVPLLRDRLLFADTLVYVRELLPAGVERSGSRIRVGAGTTIAELESSGEIPAALREACRLAASPQLRAMGTLGGNLLQSTRCWYWRLHFPCYLHGGDRCHAREGEHREHAILANDRCASAHPSDVAAALLCLGASLHTNRRSVPLSELYRLPTDDDRRLTRLEADELLLEVELEAPDASAYLKAMERAAWSFPLVGVAAARSGGQTRLALAGVAPIPWLLEGPEALDSSTPLPRTEYKLRLARVLVRRALEQLEERVDAPA